MTLYQVIMHYKATFVSKRVYFQYTYLLILISGDSSKYCFWESIREGEFNGCLLFWWSLQVCSLQNVHSG